MFMYMYMHIPLSLSLCMYRKHIIGVPMYSNTYDGIKVDELQQGFGILIIIIIIILSVWKYLRPWTPNQVIQLWIN